MKNAIIAMALLMAFSASAANGYAAEAKPQPQLAESEITNHESAQPAQTREKANIAPSRQANGKGSARAKAIRRAMAIRARIARSKKLKQQQS